MGLTHTLHIAAQNSQYKEYHEIALEVLDAGADPVSGCLCMLLIGVEAFCKTFVPGCNSYK